MCSWAATPSRGLDSAISCAKREKHSLGWVTEGVFLAGWWYTYPSEKYESQLGLLFPTEWNIKIHVPNHQPARSFVEKTWNFSGNLQNHRLHAQWVPCDLLCLPPSHWSNLNVENDSKQWGTWSEWSLINQCLPVYHGNMLLFNWYSIYHGVDYQW